MTERAMAKWPDVPAVFGWLKLDRRGRWLIRGEPVTRRTLIALIGRNYHPDERGRWYFQNGPQRVFVELEYLPWVLRRSDESLATHTGLPVRMLSAVYLDEEGSLLACTEHGAGLLSDADLPWALDRMYFERDRPLDEQALADALAQPPGATVLRLRWGRAEVPVCRIDRAQAASRFAFDPCPA